MTQTFEVGLDATLFNRVNLDLTYYKSNSLDQLFAQNVPTGSGASSRFVNGADIENSGIEAFINVGILTKGDFLWDVSFNYAANDSKVLKLAEGLDQLNYGNDFMRSINFRVERMVEAGLEIEAQRLYSNKNLPALQTLGYQEWFKHFEGKYSFNETIEEIKKNSRRYAKRQITWFNRLEAYEISMQIQIKGIKIGLNTVKNLAKDLY